MEEQQAEDTELRRALIDLLQSALKRSDKRKELIGEYQRIVWDVPESVLESQEEEILTDLGHDLDFYEPDAKLRKEDASYYDDDRLEEIVRRTLKNLQAKEQFDS